MFKNKEQFKRTFVQLFKQKHCKDIDQATAADVYQTLGLMARKEAASQWISTNRRYRDGGEKEVYYFSMEFLLGRLLENNLLNLGVLELCREGLAELGLDLCEALVEEPDAGLGNGGLGRLAACFRFAGFARFFRPRVRDSLPLWSVRAGYRRRRPGGTARRLAPQWQCLGDEAPRGGGGGEVRGLCQNRRS